MKPKGVPLASTCTLAHVLFHIRVHTPVLESIDSVMVCIIRNVLGTFWSILPVTSVLKFSVGCGSVKSCCTHRSEFKDDVRLLPGEFLAVQAFPQPCMEAPVGPQCYS